MDQNPAPRYTPKPNGTDRNDAGRRQNPIGSVTVPTAGTIDLGMSEKTRFLESRTESEYSDLVHAYFDAILDQ